MRKTSSKDQTSAMAIDLVNHFNHWSSDFVYEELASCQQATPDLHSGLDSWHESLKILTSVSETLYTTSYQIVGHEAKSNDQEANGPYAMRPPASPNSPKNGSFSEGIGPTEKPESNWVEEKNVEDTALEYVDFEEAPTEKLVVLQNEKRSEFLDPFSKPINSIQLEPSETKSRQSKSIPMLDDSEVLPDTVDFEKNQFDRSESIDFNRPSSDSDESSSWESASPIKGFGDFLDVISSEERDETEQQIPLQPPTPNDSRPTEESKSWIRREDQKNGHSYGQQSYKEVAQPSYSEIPAESLFKNEELFEQFSKTILQSYHKYYGKH